MQDVRMNLLDRIQANVNGAGILADWVGSGGEACERDVVRSRVEICTKCPQNKKGHKFEEAIAKSIFEQSQIAAEAGIYIPLPGDQSWLHACSICNCYLPLKVWVPWKHLKNFTDPAKFPQNCWIPKEAANENSTEPIGPPR